MFHQNQPSNLVGNDILGHFRDQIQEKSRLDCRIWYSDWNLDNRIQIKIFTNHNECCSKCVSLESIIKFGWKWYLGTFSGPNSEKITFRMQNMTFRLKFEQRNPNKNCYKSQWMLFKVCFNRINHQIWLEMISLVFIMAKFRENHV